MLYKYNIFATLQANQYYLRVSFDFNPMRLMISGANGTGSSATINRIDNADQVDNLLVNVFDGITGSNNNLYLQLCIDNLSVIDANFKNLNQSELAAKALECANEIKSAIANRSLHQRVSENLSSSCNII